jgi:3-oxoacyl-(acyl-carrier-protein) synthase
MPVLPVTRYQRVAIAGWDCLTAAGAARASWDAVIEQRRAIAREADIGWCGRIPRRICGPEPLAAAVHAARGPWGSIAHLDGATAWSISTSKGDMHALADALAGQPRRLLDAIPGTLGARLADCLGVVDAIPCPVAAACSTGLYAVLAAADLVERGACGRGIAGAVDRSLTPLVLAGFASLGVSCGDRAPEAFAAPTGFAPAEGAGFVALGREGAWRLVAGVRLGDAGHETHFVDPRTLLTCLRALWEACPAPELIITHGTGTAIGDAYERTGLDDGPWRAVPRRHCKPHLGHSLGASGAVELAAALCADERRIWKISLGFGGHLAAIAIVR